MISIKILLLGSGGREHALATSFDSDPFVSDLYCAPANPGIAQLARVFDIDIANPDQVVALAQKLSVDLVVIGPELPLINGVSDALAAASIACFGPSKSAAAIESSKDFAKEVMKRAGVATAQYQLCANEEQVIQACEKFGPPYVIKDDGLASGKGVVVTRSLDEAIAHARYCVVSPSRKIVVEQFLDGQEFSLFAISDGQTFLPMAPAQDYKRVGDGDQGLNTGGMGAYSPLSWVSLEDEKFVSDHVFKPVLQEMKESGKPFVGLLYAGLIKTSDGIKVIEFNARFGDPETQVLIPRLKSSLARVLFAAATKKLDQQPPLQFSDQSAVILVLAAQGYPSHPELGGEIEISDLLEPGSIFHAGTKMVGGALRSSGGRVLNILGMGNDIESARMSAYQNIAKIKLTGSFYRGDIAQLQMKRNQK